MAGTSTMDVLLQDVAKRIRQDFIPTFAAECTYWPLIQGTNFYRVPVQHQLLVSSLLLASSAMMRCVCIVPARSLGFTMMCIQAWLSSAGGKSCLPRRLHISQLGKGAR